MRLIDTQPTAPALMRRRIRNENPTVRS